jgi:hypothetical protein
MSFAIESNHMDQEDILARVHSKVNRFRRWHLQQPETIPCGLRDHDFSDAGRAPLHSLAAKDIVCKECGWNMEDLHSIAKQELE